MKRCVLILTDGKAGHENQSKAFARALGCAHDLVEVQFQSKTKKTISYLLDHVGVRTVGFFSAKSVSAEKPRAAFATLGEFCELCGKGEYAAVIGTGSGTFYAAKAAARKLGAKCGVVLYPRGYDIASFGCVLAPGFDRPAKAENVIEIPANLVASDEAFYAKGVEAFREHYRKTSAGEPSAAGEAVAVIVGGPNKCSTMTAEWMKRELDAIFGKDRQADGKTQLWVTTSRRTPPDVEAVVDSYPWDYKLLYSKDHFNPIPAFVKLARRLYVTAESSGMLSEACTFGTAEVVALDNLNPGPHKFRRFVEDLRAAGYVDGNRKVDLSGQFATARRLMGL